MRWLAFFALIFVISGSLCCSTIENIDYYFTPVTTPILQPNINITDATIAPVGRLTVSICESEDSNNAASNASVVLVADSSKKMGSEQYPFVYIFTTAKHAIPSQVKVRINPFVSKMIKSCYMIEMWSYSSSGDVGDVQKIYLCDNNTDTDYTVYRSNNHDMAVIVVFMKTEIKNAQMAYVRIEDFLDDYYIGMSISIVGCQCYTMPFLRKGVVSIMDYDDVWSSASANGGDSGGGVFDSNGQLIGIIAWKPGEGFGTGCGFIPIARLYDELLKNNMMPILREIWR
ncbi:trypsin-like peptidase domain-containing protein [Candidatus Pacearchaeota archaeon]|nr:trypsin-like peptidase domain-containing protein [Candidatus Pacearchaeota archaeon]